MSLITPKPEEVINYIQTISRTKEIEEKADRALKGTQRVEKGDINGLRVEVSNAANSAANSVKGGGVIGGSGMLGALGGRNAADGATKAAITALRSSMADQGYSQGVIDRAAQDASEAAGLIAAGMFNVDDLYNNTWHDMVPGPENSYIDLDKLADQATTLVNGMTGLDDDGNTLVLWMNGLPTTDSFIPSLLDAEGVVWDDKEVAPIDPSWTAGQVWKITGGYTGATIYGQTFFSIMTQLEMRTGLQVYSVSGVGGPTDVITGSPSYGDSPILLSSAGHENGTEVGEAGGTLINYDHVSTIRYEQVSCSSEVGSSTATAYCLSSPPRLTNWPETGVALLFFVTGQFQYFPLDSLAASLFTPGQSFVKINGLVNEYIVGPSTGGGWFIEKLEAAADDYGLLFSPSSSFVQPYMQPLSKFYTNPH